MAIFEQLLNLFASLVEACSWLWIYIETPIYSLIRDVSDYIPVFGTIFNALDFALTEIFGLNTILNDITIISLVTNMLPAVFLYMIVKNFIFSKT